MRVCVSIRHLIAPPYSPLFHVNMTPKSGPPLDSEVTGSSEQSQRDASPLPEEPETLKTTVFRRTVFKKTPSSSSVSSGRVDLCSQLVSHTPTPASTTGLSISGSYQVRSSIGRGMRPQDVCEMVSIFLDTAVAPTPNSSTVPKKHDATAGLLYQLDQISSEIIQVVITHQKDAVCEGTPIVFNDFDRTFAIHRHVGMAELHRHRRQFVKVNSMHPPSSGLDIGAAFIDFLAKQL